MESGMRSLNTYVGMESVYEKMLKIISDDSCK